MDAKWDEIDGLDFTSVKEKLRSQKNWWWKWRNDIDKLETEYKQFLYLIAVNPGKTVVPWTQQLDDFWHAHILDTRKYEEDCKKIFGKVVHHNPHLTIGSSKQKQAFNETKDMYRAAFDKKKGTAYDGDTTTSSGGDVIFMPVVFCGGGCASSHGSSHGDSGAAACGVASSGDSGGGGGCGGGGCGGGGGD
jgi:hypothetical protein